MGANEGWGYNDSSLAITPTEAAGGNVSMTTPGLGSAPIGGSYDFSNLFSNGLSFLGSGALSGAQGLGNGISNIWNATGLNSLTSNMDAKDWTAAAKLGFDAYDQFLGSKHDYNKALTNNINKHNVIADQTISSNENALMRDDRVNQYYGWA